MAYCKSCGSYVADGLEDCPACGNSTKPPKNDTKKHESSGSARATAPDFIEQEKKRESAQDEQWKRYEERKDKERELEERFRERQGQDRRGEYHGHNYDERDKTHYGDVIDHAGDGTVKLIAACSYLNWLILIPLLSKRKDKFVKHHINQALVMLIAWHLAFLTGAASGFIIGATFILGVRGFIGALSGKKTAIPFIGEIKIIK